MKTFLSDLKADIKYFDIYRLSSNKKFAEHMCKYYDECHKNAKTMVFLCIGSDRATGDCLGPLIGNIISKSASDIIVYGTLKSPVHAKNLENTIYHIYHTIDNPYVIAIDASLGIKQHIGQVTLGRGTLTPGIGVNKSLPAVGDAFITGIVNISDANSHINLQTTRLSTVVDLAEFIAYGILRVHKNF